MTLGPDDIDRAKAMPNAWTFQIPPIQDLVESYVYQTDGLWIDPFAGTSDYADVTNDLNPERDTDYTLKAREFFKEFGDRAVDGGVLFDPPYSPRQVKEMYDGIGIDVELDDVQSTFYSRLRDEIARVCGPGAVVLSFGWNSVGVGENRGFEKEEILMVCHGGAHNDTLCTVERRVNGALSDY